MDPAATTINLDSAWTVPGTQIRISTWCMQSMPCVHTVWPAQGANPVLMNSHEIHQLLTRHRVQHAHFAAQ